ncbi:MAG: glutamate synthase-related protein [Thermodesulfobacteriota bacterium]
MRPSRREQDACAIIALVDKRGHSTHGIIVKAINALKKMGHRSGDINGEGDGCGISIDLPRQIWGKRLAAAEQSRHLAESVNFFVGHFLLPAAIKSEAAAIMPRVREIIASHGGEIAIEHTGGSRDNELGPRARRGAPLFWQVAGIMEGDGRTAIASQLFRLQMAIETAIPELHTASLSQDSAVYKLQGSPELLPLVYPELRDEDLRSVMALGHSRYSTNTLPMVERCQPFSLLGHNGEINTIERLRTTGRALGIEPVPGGSDSQDLNRIIDGLIHLYGLDVMEAMEMLFPAIHSEVAGYPQELQRLYSFYRWFFPSSAQGPAAVVARYGNVCLGSVDALGLRPLWFGESDYNFFLSSEKGVVPLERTMRDPKPLAPGEKIAILGGRGVQAEILDCNAYQQRLLKLMAGRPRTLNYLADFHRDIPAAAQAPRFPKMIEGYAPPADKLLAAYGWRQYDLNIRKRVSETGREVIGSMGHTGPLAAFVPEALPNLPDYGKENVAVVTNPAIDREREAEHFATVAVVGCRPDINGHQTNAPLGLQLDNPLLIDCASLAGVADQELCRSLAKEFGTVTWEDLASFFTAGNRDGAKACFLDATFTVGSPLAARIRELCDQAAEAIAGGAAMVVLDDRLSFGGDRVYVDPCLLVALLNERLIADGLRRRAGIVVRSGAIRNLHDIMFLLGLGADALVPHLLWRAACANAGDALSVETVLRNNLTVLQKGIEKVMSTMGIHELCGYGRIFSTIGLTREMADLMQIPNFCEDGEIGLSLAAMEQMAAARYRTATGGDEVAPYKDPTRNPKVGKILRSVAVGKMGYAEMAKELRAIDESLPTGVRHCLDLRAVDEAQRTAMDKVDITIGRHAMPVVIAAMSFGSQGENSFRAYAEAGRKANIICMNGEGGEIPDMLGRYRHNRGQQIASGRFGVYMGFLNSADYLEIKIGQGAKPGEGGHLPGNKVSEMVAKSRHCKQGITLISPSNHHDIYSIEDLAQIITELKTANPEAKISVKVPITSGVGTIAVGVAKAGADIINLSGFEGGTGAAREHAKRFVGLPAEIGVNEAHKALLESCLREKVELWVDGGMRSGADVVKMILLGANRVGLGTVALMGVGCISCERCHLDRCPRGISTQLRTVADAEARGVKGFSPRVMETEAENLARLLAAIGDEIKMHVAAMGETSLQELVGRTDLLRQVSLDDRISAKTLLAAPERICNPEEYPAPQIVRKPLSYLTRLVSDLAMARFEQGFSSVHFTEEQVRSTDRAMGTYLAGAIERRYGGNSGHLAKLRLRSSVPGNGLAAFTTANLDVIVEGGSQDGAAKGASGGVLGVLKGRNLRGAAIDGSTGKSFAYGAIGGLFIVQNMADSRACIRMSGADVVFGGRITAKVRDDLGNLASRAHLKGFAFEYMTGGRAVVLGDPGPWICAGMTGGVIHQCLYPEFGFDRESVRRRLARGASMLIERIDEQGLVDVGELLSRYIRELEDNLQEEEANAVRILLAQAAERFVTLVPRAMRPPSAE